MTTMISQFNKEQVSYLLRINQLMYWEESIQRTNHLSNKSEEEEDKEFITLDWESYNHNLQQQDTKKKYNRKQRKREK